MTGNAGHKSRPSGRNSFERVQQRGDGQCGQVPGQQVHVVVVLGELGRLRAGQTTSTLCHEDQINVERENDEPAMAALLHSEDLCVSGLARSRLARSVADAGWSQLLGLIEEKAARYGRTFARIGRFEPTSQVCSACGASDGPKPLHVRAWACAACGTVHDRDVNAARNILAAGRADKSNACGGQVRPAPMLAPASEAGTLRGAA
jgi:Putative transposase DNA-binding domain